MMADSLGFTLGINGAAGNTLFWKFSFDHQRHVVFCTHNGQDLFMGESMAAARDELAKMIDRLRAYAEYKTYFTATTGCQPMTFADWSE